MQQSHSWVAAAILAAGMVAGSAILASSLIEFRAMERVVQVKGLSEREVAADSVIWPIKFNDVDNNLTTLVANLERKNEQIQAFLKLQGFSRKRNHYCSTTNCRSSGRLLRSQRQSDALHRQLYRDCVQQQCRFSASGDGEVIGIK